MTVLTLTGLSLETAVNCDVCQTAQALVTDQLDKCYCDNCVYKLPYCGDCRQTYESQNNDGAVLPLYNSWTCNDCVEEDYSPCDECDRFSLNTELVKTEEGAEYVCQLCFDHHYTKCCCCNLVFVTPSMISSPNDEPYCETCADDVICHCSECGEAVWREDCDHTEDGDAMCEGCYRDVCSSNNLDNPDDWCDLYIHNYSYDVRAALGLLGSPKDRIFYGVELEVVVDGDREDFENAACGVSQSLANFALLKADSSIDPGGFEIVTTAAQFDLHYKHWQSLFDALPSCLRVNSTTGLHVHVSKKRLSQLRMGKILVFLNRDLNRSLCQAIAGRKHCSYAQYKHKNFSHAKENNSDRYEVVAIRSKTLEFRLFAATLDPDVFFARLEFVKALVAFSYETSCRHLSDRDFIEFVLSKQREYKYLYRQLVMLNQQGVINYSN